MASTNKTPQLGLNQWAAGDEVIRTDFNADNAKLDAAVGANEATAAAALALAAGKLKAFCGSAIGDGISNRQFSIGFRPTLVLLQCLYMGENSVSIITPNCTTTVSNNSAPVMQFSTGDMLLITESGFSTSNAVYYNKLNSEIFYLAFG